MFSFKAFARFFCVLILAQTLALANEKTDNATEKITIDNINEKLNQACFIENKGQWDEQVLFMANTRSLRAWITKKAIIFQQIEVPEDFYLQKIRQDVEKQEIRTYAVGLEFVKPLDYTIKESKARKDGFPVHFMIGNDKSKHAMDARQFTEFTTKDVYDGIDMRFYFDEGELRYDFIVAPGADPGQIEFEIKGSDNVYLNDGELVLETPLRPVIQKGLEAFQENEGKKQNVSSRFELKDNRLKIKTGEYDRSKQLIIDPLTMLRFIEMDYNAQQWTSVHDIDFDLEADELVYLAETFNPGFPFTGGIYNGSQDLVVGKIDLNLRNIGWSLIMGSPGWDYAAAISVGREVLNQKTIFIAGSAPAGFPEINAPFSYNWYSDMFFVEIDSSGSVETSSYYGGQDADYCRDMVFDSDNNLLYLVGDVRRITPINENTLQDFSNGDRFGVIAAFQCEQNYNEQFVSRFGGESHTYITGIDLQPGSSYFFITGTTLSTEIPFFTTSGCYQEQKNSNEPALFVSKLHFNTSIQELEIDYNSFFGNGTSSWTSIPMPCKISNGGSDSIVYIGGSVDSDMIPMSTSNNFFDGRFSCRNWEGFVAKFILDEQGQLDLDYSSYLGTVGDLIIHDVDYMDYCGKLAVTGQSTHPIQNHNISLNLPFNWGGSAFLAVFDPNENGVNSLVDLGYFNNGSHPGGQAIKHVSGSNILYVGGWYNGALWKFQSNTCSGDCDPVDTYLTVTTVPGGVCGQDECEVTIDLNINSGSFDNYKVYVNNNLEYTEDPISLPYKDPISYFTDYCLPNGVSSRVDVELYDGNQLKCTLTELVSCCECPAGSDDWLRTELDYSGNNCTVDQCEWRYHLDIPAQYLNSYPEFTFELEIDGVLDYSGTGYTNSWQYMSGSGCIDKGQTVTIRFELTGPNCSSSCIIEKTLECESCSQDKDSWIELSTTKNDPSCSPGECLVQTVINAVPNLYTEYRINGSSWSQIPAPGSQIESICVPAGTVHTVNVELAGIDICSISKSIGCNISDNQQPCDPFGGVNFENPPKQATFLVEGSTDCYIRVTYTWRFYGVYQDLQILSIERYGDPGANCNGWNNEEIYKMAIQRLLWENEMQFQPIPNGPPHNHTRIMGGNCWIEWDKTIGNITTRIIEPCYDACCVQEFRISRMNPNSMGIIHVGKHWPYPALDCDGRDDKVADGQTYDCNQGVCDWLDNWTLHMIIAPKQPMLDEESAKEIFDGKPGDLTYKLNVSNTNEQLRILIDETNGSDIQIHISNMNGDILHTQNSSLNAGLNRYDIDISSFVSGVYMYNLVINGQIARTGKFTIVK